MKPIIPRNKWIALFIVGLIVFSLSLLQGCDAFSSLDEDEASTPELTGKTPALVSAQYVKLRHPQLMDRARVVSTHLAGKTESSATQLVLGLNLYEADGMTPRLLDKYDVTRRLLQKYGITTRLLDKYGDNIRFKLTYDQAVNAITVKVNDTILDEFLTDIEADPDFSWVEPDIEINVSLLGRVSEGRNSSQIIPWSIERIGAYVDGILDFKNVEIYVLDSGIHRQSELVIREHKDFTMLFQNRSEEYWDDAIVQETPVYDPKLKGDPEDYSGHGTHVAGIIGAKTTIRASAAVRQVSVYTI